MHTIDFVALCLIALSQSANALPASVPRAAILERRAIYNDSIQVRQFIATGTGALLDRRVLQTLAPSASELPIIAPKSSLGSPLESIQPTPVLESSKIIEPTLEPQQSQQRTSWSPVLPTQLVPEASAQSSAALQPQTIWAPTPEPSAVPPSIESSIWKRFATPDSPSPFAPELTPAAPSPLQTPGHDSNSAPVIAPSVGISPGGPSPQPSFSLSPAAPTPEPILSSFIPAATPESPLFSSLQAPAPLSSQVFEPLVSESPAPFSKEGPAPSPNVRPWPVSVL